MSYITSPLYSGHKHTHFEEGVAKAIDALLVDFETKCPVDALRRNISIDIPDEAIKKLWLGLAVHRMLEVLIVRDSIGAATVYNIFQALESFTVCVLADIDSENLPVN